MSKGRKETDTNKEFNKDVKRVSNAIKRHLDREGKVSSVDISKTTSTLDETRRGATVVAAFNRLINENVLMRTKETESRNGKKVAVYSKV